MRCYLVTAISLSQVFSIELKTTLKKFLDGDGGASSFTLTIICFLINIYSYTTHHVAHHLLDPLRTSSESDALNEIYFSDKVFRF